MLLQEKYKDYRIILASKSPRRQNLFKGFGLEFETIVKEIDEDDYPAGLEDKKIPEYLAEKKAEAFGIESMSAKTLVITADTMVFLDEHVLNKPGSRDEAKKMLKILSGKMHQVVTGICLKTKEKTRTFSVTTDVYFRELSEEETEYYIDTYKPYDKAGAYGAQEWIGYIGIDRISGSYFNVVGLPTHRLYEEMKMF
jgi:septum formation protein